MVHRHILLQTFPTQGSINPCLQFAKNLARMGVKVTVVVSLSVQRHIDKQTSSTLKDFTIVAFSDGYDDGLKLDGLDHEHFRSQLKTRGSTALSQIISANAEQGYPVTGLVSVMLLPWTAEVARAFNIPFSILWIQPASIFDIYFYYFNGYDNAIKNIITDAASCHVELPGLPKLTKRDLPSFMVSPSSFSASGLPAFKEQLDTLDQEAKPIVFINTFKDLEANALRSINKYKLVAVGPLVPSAYLDGTDNSDTSFGGDLLQNPNHDYVKWLDSKPQESVVYVAFGSFIILSDRQMEEIARGLLETRRPFLWVIRVKENGESSQEAKISCKEELKKQGVIVPWCSQVEVLSHPSLGCFVTHCGWNSTLESLASGTPVVGIPQFTDQPTNAKLLQDEFKTGVRAKVNEEGIVEGEEIKKCIELVLGSEDVGEEIRGNAKKWKYLAKEAAKEGGSSYNNLKAFVDEGE